MTTPICGAELLSVADDLLISYDSAAPRPALLRRAISSAYYALFHDLVSQAVRQTVGTDPARDPDRHAIARFYSHGDVRAVSRWVLDRAQRRTLPDRVSALLDTPTPDLVLVTSALIALQDSRHDAAYNRLVTFTPADARSSITRARAALAPADDGRGVPALLLLGPQAPATERQQAPDPK